MMTVYTAEEAAQILKVTKKTVHVLVKTGRLEGKYITDGRRCLRVTEEALRNFLEQEEKA